MTKEFLADFHAQYTVLLCMKYTEIFGVGDLSVVTWFDPYLFGSGSLDPKLLVGLINQLDNSVFIHIQFFILLCFIYSYTVYYQAAAYLLRICHSRPAWHASRSQLAVAVYQEVKRQKAHSNVSKRKF
jgi:hypothetical protein